MIKNNQAFCLYWTQWPSRIIIRVFLDGETGSYAHLGHCSAVKLSILLCSFSLGSMFLREASMFSFCAAHRPRYLPFLVFPWVPFTKCCPILQNWLWVYPACTSACTSFITFIYLYIHLYNPNLRCNRQISLPALYPVQVWGCAMLLCYSSPKGSTQICTTMKMVQNQGE